MSTDRLDLVAALTMFNEWSKIDSIHMGGIEVGVNDISLIYGGSYEYQGDWNLNSKHSFHRIGLSVDIDQTLTDEQLDQLTRFIEDTFQGTRHPERPQIHYSFRGAN